MLRTSCKALLIVATSVTFTGCVPLAVQQPSEQSALDNSSRDFNYEVQPGDRLTDIALALTGDIGNWETIASYNDVTEPRRLATGTILRIPGRLRSDGESREDSSLDPGYAAVAGNGKSPTVATGRGATMSIGDINHLPPPSSHTQNHLIRQF